MLSTPPFFVPKGGATTMQTWFQLVSIDAPTAYALFPCARRFINLGFQVDPLLHEDGKLGLKSVNQTLRLDLETGDVECVLSAS